MLARRWLGRVPGLVCLGFVGLGGAAAVFAAGQPTSPSTPLDSYVGRYELTPSFHLTVTREGRALYLQATGQPRAQLTPRSRHEFVLGGSSLRVMFNVRSDTGEVLDLVFEQGGLGRRAVKLDADVVTAGRSRMVVSPDVLTEYVGSYEEQPGFGITITLGDGGLLAQMTEMPQVPIFPESPTQFFYEDSTARITFRVDVAGAATALVLHQGGSDLEMPRLEK